MFRNEFLLSALAAWILAQLIKTLISTVKTGSFQWDRVIGDGGMPSAHSATVCALAASAAKCYGVSSFEFAVTLIMTIIVMHDASGVRLESGKQAKAINELREHIQALAEKSREERLDELLGHTPSQVFFGAVLGIAVALAVCFFFD